MVLIEVGIMENYSFNRGSVLFVRCLSTINRLRTIETRVSSSGTEPRQVQEGAEKKYLIFNPEEFAQSTTPEAASK